MKVNYSAVPHAVFSHPQIASVGLTEAEAHKKGEIAVAATSHFDTARGTAMMENEGFAKVVPKAGGGYDKLRLAPGKEPGITHFGADGITDSLYQTWYIVAPAGQRHELH